MSPHPKMAQDQERQRPSFRGSEGDSRSSAHPQILLLLQKHQSCDPNRDEFFLLGNTRRDGDTLGGCSIWYRLPAALQFLSQTGTTSFHRQCEAHLTSEVSTEEHSNKKHNQCFTGVERKLRHVRFLCCHSKRHPTQSSRLRSPRRLHSP